MGSHSAPSRVSPPGHSCLTSTAGRAPSGSTESSSSETTGTVIGRCTDTTRGETSGRRRDSRGTRASIPREPPSAPPTEGANHAPNLLFLKLFQDLLRSIHTDLPLRHKAHGHQIDHPAGGSRRCRDISRRLIARYTSFHDEEPTGVAN